MIDRIVQSAGLLALISASQLLTAQDARQQAVPAICKADDLLRRIHANNDTTYVVNFWATWCKPCVAELPEFEALQKAHASEPVKVILVSLDFREDLEKRLIPFLNKHGYQCEVLLLNESNGNDFIDKIDPRWSGAIPATLITSRRWEGQVILERSVTKSMLETEISR